jgi:serine/threonine protein kinase
VGFTVLRFQAWPLLHQRTDTVLKAVEEHVPAYLTLLDQMTSKLPSDRPTIAGALVQLRFIRSTLPNNVLYKPIDTRPQKTDSATVGFQPNSFSLSVLLTFITSFTATSLVHYHVTNNCLLHPASYVEWGRHCYGLQISSFVRRPNILPVVVPF